ncbi:hypothetical protein N9N67_08325 [Bacteriovoracaceae bacterium]|nr:hypothetical protein [Bacteriovoracaceae bacterium]
MKKLSLFIDTSQCLKLGLIDSSKKFISFTEISDKKCGDIIHTEINKLLTDQGLSLFDLSSCFFLMGPGSYTGLRFTQGIMDLFKMENIECYSFYWFDIPWLLNPQNNDKYIFMTNAFKGESLILWIKDGEIEQQKLILNKDVPKFSETISEKIWKIDGDLSNAFDRDYAQVLQRVEDLKSIKPIYYFRSDIEEFTPAL